MPSDKRRQLMLPLCLAVLLGTSFAATSHVKAADTTLYDRLGGAPTVTRIADLLVTGFLADPRIAADFDNINLDRLRQRLADFICVVADGPCLYKGRSMKASHKGLHVNQAHFNAVVEDLQDAMDKVGVGFHTQNVLLARLAPMQRDIVTR
jgi:hemoglobin